MSAPLGLRPRRNYRRNRWRKHALLGLVVLLFPAGFLTARLLPAPPPPYAELLYPAEALSKLEDYKETIPEGYRLKGAWFGPDDTMLVELEKIR